MRHSIIYLSAIGALLTSCLEDTFPTSTVTEEQMMQSESSVESLNVGIAASVMNYGSTYSHAAYPALMMWRDIHCAELPIYSTAYDYFSNTTKYMGDGQLYYDWWYQYFNTIHNANNVIGLVDPATAQQQTLVYLGNALGYRAWCYLEASQMWEFKRTGVTTLDTYADEHQLWGQTVPIVTEKTTKEEARQNPRAPFWQMYRFIHNDLMHALQYLEGYERTQCNEMNQACIYALQARLWMLMGSRFEESAADLQAQLSHENDADGYASLGIATATDCFARAKDCATKAMALTGLPLMQREWMDATSGFNAANSSWILGIEIIGDDIAGNESWKSFVSFMSPEADFGVANTTYQATRLCDASLYQSISDSDWRKTTWVSPDDAGDKDAAQRYATLLTSSEFAELPALSGLKFHPADGERTNYQTGAAVDLPIIRVEEMFFIQAEAAARTEGVAAGVQLLETFVNHYRYTDNSYSCQATDMESFIDALMLQKRIEFWGEGIVFWDYKRLRLPVKRSYEGSNHPSSYQYNSLAGYVPRWMNYYIPSNEYQYNKALAQNPDPSYTDGMEY